MFGFFYIFTIKYKTMKKILFLLLLSIATYGQIVPTGQEQDFDYGIRNTASQLDDNAAFITVQDATGVQGKSTSSVWAKKIYVDNADATKSFLSTGLIKNGLVTTNADPTKFNITAGIGIITNFDNPEIPTSTIVSFPAFTGITPTYLTSGNITYVAITLAAGVPVVLMQATPFDNVQRRNVIALGAVIHSNLSTINLVNNISAPTNAGTNQLHDLYEFIGALNLTGNKYTANGANLSLDKTAGTIGKLGVNFANNWRDPNRLSIGLQTSLMFRYRTQNGTEGLDITSIDPSVYDLNNVLTAVPVNRFSIQTVTLFQTGQTRIQFGQNTYATMAEAEAAIITRAYNVESNIAANGITRAYIILRHNATDLTNATTSKIIEAQKFGGVASGGVALTDSAIIAALGFTPENVSNKSDSYNVSSSTTYASTKAVVDGLGTKIGGTGTTNYVPRFTGSGTLGNSSIYNNGTNIGIGLTNPVGKLHIAGFANTTDVGQLTLSEIDNSNRRITIGVNNLANWGFMQMLVSGDNYYPLYLNPNGGNVGINTTTDDGVNKLQVNGSTKTTALTLTTAPTTSAGTYDIVTRNTSTGVVEKVLSNTIATVASPTFTGTPTAPTAAPGTNTTQIATTAFVKNSYTYNNGVRISDVNGSGTGEFNNVIGVQAMIVPTSGSRNNIFGHYAMRENYAGSDNSVYGNTGGANTVGGGSSFSHDKAVFIGSRTRPKFDGGINEIIIGAFTDGNGSNTATLGNDDIVKTILKGVINTPKTYTVATLPTGVLGDKTIVTDATSPTYLGTLTGGGSVVCPVFYNGTAWVSH